jgi:hypothetical protein
LIGFFSQICLQNSVAQNPETSLKLSPEQYLEEVKNQNLGYLSANKSFESFELLKEKAKLVSAIKLYALSEKSFAEQVRTTNLFTYKSLNIQNNRIGFTQNSEFGLSTDIHYTLLHNNYKGMDTSRFGGNPLASSNYQAIPGIEVSFPLWQNRFGSTTRATKDSIYFDNSCQYGITKGRIDIAPVDDDQRTFVYYGEVPNCDVWVTFKRGTRVVTVTKNR